MHIYIIADKVNNLKAVRLLTLSGMQTYSYPMANGFTHFS